MKLYNKARIIKPEPNFINLVSISLILIVFIFALVPLHRHSFGVSFLQTNLQYPSSVTPNQVLLRIFPRLIWVNGVWVEDGDLQSNIMKEIKNSQVFIDVEPDVSYERVIYVVEKLRGEGVLSVSLSPSLSSFLK